MGRIVYFGQIILVIIPDKSVYLPRNDAAYWLELGSCPHSCLWDGRHRNSIYINKV